MCKCQAHRASLCVEFASLRYFVVTWNPVADSLLLSSIPAVNLQVSLGLWSWMFIKDCEFAPHKLCLPSPFFLNRGWRLFCPITVGNTHLLNLPGGGGGTSICLYLLICCEVRTSQGYLRIIWLSRTLSHLRESVLICMSRFLRSLGGHLDVAQCDCVHQLLKYLPSLHHNVAFEHLL